MNKDTTSWKQSRRDSEDSKVNWGLLDLDRDREADIADLFHARRGGPVGLGDIGAAQALPAIDHRMIFGTLVPRPFLLGTLSDVIQAEVTGDDVINLGFGPILDLLGKDLEAGNPNRAFVLHDQVVPRWRHTIGELHLR
ncbi:hypothetical protein GE061_002781 [Apolygus lucorum]|uniref:Uncharacterized protein n=1 Tax=Apolygus lucorum TaxID=248454 RepID=A0A8S9X5S4_APOLU|nr:hypothetical protein GE061_002781 [Apolygus lucorum]